MDDVKLACTTSFHWLIKCRFSPLCSLWQHQSVRKRALDDVKLACTAIAHATVHHIQFEKLDFGETNVLDLFYNADVAIIDLSIQVLLNVLISSVSDFIRKRRGKRQEHFPV